jgi:hypothetical protein
VSRRRAPIVILWSKTRRVWEAWAESRPLAESGQLDRVVAAYPDAQVVHPEPKQES